MNLKLLVRECVQRATPYKSAREEFSGTAKMYLDANENAFGSATSQPLSRYPDPKATALREKLARLYGVLPESIIAGNGSDEIIQLLVSVFCEPRQDSIAIMPPTFGMYAVIAESHGVAVRAVPTKEDFTLPESLLEDVRGAKLLFLCSPNNPTGNCYSLETVAQLARNFSGLLVLDEAYIEFSQYPSACQLLTDMPNLFVLRTLSKAWGLAGVRFGCGIGNPEVIEYLQRVKLPYNVNALTQAAASEAVDRQDFLVETIEQVKHERNSFASALESLAVVERVYPSEGNFLLVKVCDADAAYSYLLSQGIVVRSQSKQIHCENCLRITVGTAEENTAVVRALKEMS